MGIRWQIQFKSFLGTSYVLNIYDSSWALNGTVTQLIGADVPFITSEDNDQDIYKPIRNQSGYVRFIAENASIVSQMIPSDPTDRPVVLRSGNNNIMWAGFLSNEQYTQPWEPCPYAVEIPVVSMMMAMQGVKFTQSEGYTSLLSLLNIVGSYLPFYTDMVIPDSIPIDGIFVNNNNFREFLTVQERAERGTNDIYECKYIYDCIEEFCKYFGISLREYAGSFYFITHNAQEYDGMDLNGNALQIQWGSGTLEALTICGSNNNVDYSKAYRRISGNFDTGRNKLEEMLSFDSFLQNFSIQGAYPDGAPRNFLFNGNTEVMPYKNGIQQTSWIQDNNSEYGGQIIRRRGGIDCFSVYSLKSQAGSPQKAIVFNVPKKVYINSGEYSALNITCLVEPWYTATQGGDFIKRLHCKVKVGNYWLKSEIPSASPNMTNYSWTTTESSCWLKIDSGSVTMENTIITLHYQYELEMDTVTGFAIDLPSGLSPGYHDLYMELLCNSEATADFGEYSAIGYYVKGLNVKILRAINSFSDATPDIESNSIIRFNEIRGDEYSVDCTITTKRGVQFGAGMALDNTHAYIPTKYDELGITRRAAALGVSKEILTVKVRANPQPIDLVSENGNYYNILSQSMNWRDDQNTIKIIRR